MHTFLRAWWILFLHCRPPLALVTLDAGGAKQYRMKQHREASLFARLGNVARYNS